MDYTSDLTANGTGSTVETENKSARVDPVRGVFITSHGDEIELTNKPISSLILERVINQGKPAVPHIKITLLGKHEEIQENPNDPGYRAALTAWNEERSLRMMRYIFNIGVKGTPPQAFLDEHLQFFPDATPAELKYLWVISRIPDADIDAFSEAVLGQTYATLKGLGEAAESLRGEDQRAETG